MAWAFLKNSYLRIVDGLSKNEITAVKAGIRALEDEKIHHEKINDFLDALLTTINPYESKAQASQNTTDGTVHAGGDLDETSFESGMEDHFGKEPADSSVAWPGSEENFSDIIAQIPHESPWLIGMSEGFVGSIKSADRKILGRALAALNDLCRDPMASRGDTIKPLGRELKGCWRYQIEKFRIIYKPDGDKKEITLISMEPHGTANG